MAIWATSNAVFQTSGQFSKVKAYAIPNVVTALKPSSPYDFYVNGINMDWAVKPYGGNLSQQLVSDGSGKLIFTYYFEQQYFHGYAIAGLASANTFLTFELRGRDNVSTFYYVPVNLRGSQ